MEPDFALEGFSFFAWPAALLKIGGIALQIAGEGKEHPPRDVHRVVPNPFKILGNHQQVHHGLPIPIRLL